MRGQALQSRQGNLWLFADDALLYGIVSSDVDGDQLQEDLKKLEVWQNKWQISFNPAKCKTICLPTTCKKVPPERKYVFCGVKLEQVASMSYLGVILNNNWTWSNDVSSISGKANKVLGLIKRSLRNCPKQVKETAYTVIVRPKLEYACAAWDPYLRKDINSLERVRKKAVCFCTNGYYPTASVTKSGSLAGKH